MRRTSLGVSIALALVSVACGGGDPATSAREPGEPIIQIVSEGGFVPMEVAMGSGPGYTVLADGTLIYAGVMTMQFPGPLMPPYMEAKFTESQLNAILALVDRMGLPEIDDESDDSAQNTVADASTEAITYWDEDGGEHRYSVYALGIQETPGERNETFLEILDTLGQFSLQTDSQPYEPETIQVVAGPGFVDPQFEDTRPWPLPSTDLGEWADLGNGWVCNDFDSSALETMGDANGATTWEHPDGTSDPMTFLVRPLLPGEDGCV